MTKIEVGFGVVAILLCAAVPTSAANAQVRNLDTNSDCSASAADIVSEWGTSLNMTTPTGSAAGQRLAVQLVADARL